MAALLSVLVLGAGSAGAQDELPGDDPAAWLVEASVQARRISGVGDELTEALQTKGALLAHIAVAQQAIGEVEAAARNERIVSLCLRALAHDGEDGWVRAAQAQALIEYDRSEDAQNALQLVSNADERAAARAWLDGEPIPADIADGVGRGFASQRDWFATHQAVRSEAATVARHGTVRDAQVWVGVLDDPAERAWASVGVAQGLQEAASVSASDALRSLPEVAEAIVDLDPPVTPEIVAPAEVNAAPDIVASPEVAVAPEQTTAPKQAAVAEIVDPAERISPPEVEVSVAPETDIPAAVVSVPLVVVEPKQESASVETTVSAETTTASEATTSTAASEDIETSEVAETTEATATTEISEASTIADDIGGVVPPASSVESDAMAEPAVADAVTPASDPVAPASEMAPALIPVVPDLTTLVNPSAVLGDEPAPDVYDLEFTTTKGVFTVRVHRDWAPLAADRFRDLAVSGFYQNQRFFRVVPGFVVQWGIHGYPDVAAAWRPQMLLDEPGTQPNRRGTVVFAAATQPNTRTTQVFINLADNVFLDDLGFVPFGEITAGMDVVESLFGGYGETPSEKQREIQLQGNTFLDARYPELDSIISVQLSPAE